MESWNIALDRGMGTMIPDSRGYYIEFSRDSFFLSAGNVPDKESVQGIYIQSFNNQSVVLVLPDSSLLPPFPRLITSPFLEVLLGASGFFIAGGENLTPQNIIYSGGNEFTRELMKGFSMYGIPLSDPVPEVPAMREAQRYSKGWMIRQL